MHLIDPLHQRHMRLLLVMLAMLGIKLLVQIISKQTPCPLKWAFHCMTHRGIDSQNSAVKIVITSDELDQYKQCSINVFMSIFNSLWNIFIFTAGCQRRQRCSSSAALASMNVWNHLLVEAKRTNISLEKGCHARTRVSASTIVGPIPTWEHPRCASTVPILVGPIVVRIIMNSKGHVTHGY